MTSYDMIFLYITHMIMWDVYQIWARCFLPPILWDLCFALIFGTGSPLLVWQSRFQRHSSWPTIWTMIQGPEGPCSFLTELYWFKSLEKSRYDRTDRRIPQAEASSWWTEVDCLNILWKHRALGMNLAKMIFCDLWSTFNSPPQVAKLYNMYIYV